jgi:hypothetical protein
MNPKKNVGLLMQRSNIKWLLLLLVTVLTMAACSSSKGIFKKKNDCGCPNKKGMVGY